MSGVGLSLSPEVLAKCVALSTSLRVSPSRMAESWEAHSLNRGVHELTVDTFDSYRMSLRKDVDSSPSSSQLITTPPSKTTNMDRGGGGLVRPNASFGKRKMGSTGNAAAVITPSDANGSFDVSSASAAVDAKKRKVGEGGESSRTMADSGRTSTVDSVAIGPDAAAAESSSSSGSGGGKGTNFVPPVSGKTYDERTNVGEVVESYNPRNFPEWDPSSYHSTTTSSSSAAGWRRRCVVSLLEEERSAQATAGPGRYRYMFTPPEERAKALDAHLVEIGDIMKERYGLRGEEEGEAGEAGKTIAPLEAVGVPRQAKVCCIGRICNDAHSGRLNRNSLLLEGSRHLSRGNRVHLDVSALASSGISYSLFPGQIVAVEGINASGSRLVAERICEGAAPPLPTCASERLLTYHHGDSYQGGESLRLVAACGPYTTSDNLDYLPLLDLLETVRSDRPDVVFLVGPFVDLNQPIVEGGDVALGLEGEGGGRMSVTYETLFVEKVARTLEELYERVFEEEGRELRTQFVLVPSLNDANADFNYPQPPFGDRLPNGGREVNLPNSDGITYGTLGLQHIETAGRGKGGESAAKRVHCVPNPCTLRINELVVGVTSTDVIMHMSMDETNANLEPRGRLRRLAQHLVQQRSYYPLFPPPAPSSGICPPNLDLKRMAEWEMPCQPDLLIFPSKLAAFVKPVLGATVALNPGLLSKGTMGGTYAAIDVHPMKRETLEGLGVGVNSEHGAQDRIRVEVKRI